MPGRRGTVHELLISDHAFAIIATAIHRLNLKTQRFNTLRDVVALAFEEDTLIDPALLEEFSMTFPVDGPVRIFFRADGDERDRIERAKMALCEHLKGPCNAREVIVFCAYLLTKKFG